MAIFLISFLAFVLAALGMALGLVLRGRPLRQSCAGIIGMETSEGVCPGCGRGNAQVQNEKREAA